MPIIYCYVSTLPKQTTTKNNHHLYTKGLCANVSDKLPTHTLSLSGEPIEKTKSSLGIAEPWSADVDRRYSTINGYDFDSAI